MCAVLTLAPGKHRAELIRRAGQKKFSGNLYKGSPFELMQLHN